MAILIDPKFLALIVHDLRNPLNVMSLALRMIDQMRSRNLPSSDEDFEMIRQNVAQLERMLEGLSDYCRLFEAGSRPNPMACSARRLLTEAIEIRAERLPASAPPVEIRFEHDCPDEVVLDQSRARLAILYALENATAATKKGPILVKAGGGPDRLEIAIAIEEAPRETVQPTALGPDVMERLVGTAAERRGLELAIAARVSELFGGTARLDVEKGRTSAIILDWPARMQAA